MLTFVLYSSTRNDTWNVQVKRPMVNRICSYPYEREVESLSSAIVMFKSMGLPMPVQVPTSSGGTHFQKILFSF